MISELPIQFAVNKALSEVFAAANMQTEMVWEKAIW